MLQVVQLVTQVVDCLVLVFDLIAEISDDAGVTTCKISLPHVDVQLTVLELRLQVKVFSLETLKFKNALSGSLRFFQGFVEQCFQLHDDALLLANRVLVKTNLLELFVHLGEVRLELVIAASQRLKFSCYSLCLS